MYQLNQAYRLTGPSDGRSRLIKKYQSSGDIVAALIQAVNKSVPVSREFAQTFKRNTPEETCQAIYDWMRTNYIYQKEPGTYQTAKTLPRIISDSKKGSTGDCKHFSTTAATICKCLGLPVYFRVIDQIGRYNHIYTVVKIPGRKVIIIDGTYPYFNRQTSFRKKTDIPV